MTWVGFAVLTALCDSLNNVCCKKGLRGVPSEVVACLIPALSALLLSVLFFFIPIPELSWQFWASLVFCALLDAVAIRLFMAAVASTDMSLCIPMLSFTPIFTASVGIVLLDQWPSLAGSLGILLIIVGSYVLQLRSLRNGLFAPFYALLENPGTRAMLIASVIWGVTGVVDRIGVAHSSPLFWAAVLPLGIALPLIPAALAKLDLAQLRPRMPWMCAAAVCYSGMVAFHMIGITLGLVVYVVSVKRLSLALSVVWGRLFFGETQFGQRLLATAVMLLGVFILSAS